MSKKTILSLFGIAAALAIAAPAGAGAAEDDCKPAVPSFGLCGIDQTITGDPQGTPALLAGTHPFALNGSIAVKTEEVPSGETAPVEEVKDLKIYLPSGLIGSRTAVPQCPVALFLQGQVGECENATAIGVARITFIEPGLTQQVPIFNLTPSPGSAAKIGFMLVGRAPVTIDLGLNPKQPYNLIATGTNIAQAAFFFRAETAIWGVPADPRHNSQRGKCATGVGGDCPVTGAEVVPFITLPMSCEGPLRTDFEVDSWEHPGQWVTAPTFLSHDDSDPPNPLPMGGCDSLPSFAPQPSAKPTTDQAESPSGLDFSLSFDDPGLTSASGVAQSTIKKAIVTLPAGVTLNPSTAEGLATCSLGQLERESADSEPGEGCPQASKVGTVEVETPLLEGTLLKGSLFVAEQDDPAKPGHENTFDSLIALYMVIKDPGLGIVIKLPGRVQPNEEAGPNAGRLITTFGEPGFEIPQLAHFSHLRLHLSEGARSPLITPAHCGTYTTDVELIPWAAPAEPSETSTSFQINHGVGGGPCPPGGTPPFDPGFSAGTLNNNTKAYSPFDMRITRRDGDQDLTKLSAQLPPGVIGSIVGIAKCGEAQIAAARERSGRAEIASPSCPASSQIGRTEAGAGVGSQLTYVPGKLYLAGPYRGDPLSVVSITPAVAGPFDVGTVVVRFALAFNPITLQVEADGSASDPIPHVLKGIVLKLTDLRAYIDRDRFIFNPTNCDPFQASATLFGSAANVFDPVDDVPVTRTNRFQAANCASLGFKPKISLSLKGGTRRGDHPAFKAVVTPRPEDANFSKAVVTLPRSAFLDQAHIRTICTRVQYAAKACPPGSVYGFARAWSPLVDGPAEGPVYLRSSNHNLPDLVMALKGPPSAEVNFDVVGRIDSHKGGIRSSFETLPDVPVSKFVLDMRGGKKGLIINSRSLCSQGSTASAGLIGQNGRRDEFGVPVRPTGCKDKKSARHRHARP
jgi:hypothetical protein